jgi:hypothetical protein
MLKRCYQKDVYLLKGRYGRYIVQIDNYAKDIYGNAKYEAVVSNISEPLNDFDDDDIRYCYNAVYRFQTHYTGTAKEAKYILNVYEKDLDKKGE